MPLTYRTMLLGLLLIPTAALAIVPTTTTLVISPSGSVQPGTVVTLTATVTAAGNPVPRGSVFFCNASRPRCADVAVLGQSEIARNGTATLKMRFGFGAHSIRAVFQGTSALASSPSVSATVTVAGLNPTSTTLTGTGKGAGFQLQASVTAANSSPPSGMLSFVDASQSNASLGSVVLNPAGAIATFTPRSQTNGGGTYDEVAVGDLNNDGFPDEVYIDGSILLGKGDGTFTAMTFPIHAGEFPGSRSLLIEDFDGDGIPDLAYADFGPDINILIGKGDGTFTAKSVFAGASPMAKGDFNRDGIPDLVFVTPDGQSIAVALGTGDGTFSPPTTTAVGHFIYSLTTADFNGDGAPDVATVSAQDNTTDILLNVGDGSFAVHRSAIVHHSFPYVIDSADFNQDGIADLATANNGDSVNVFLGIGDGSFQPPLPTNAGVTINQWVLGDFNGDGLIDIAGASNGVIVLFGNGDGTLRASAPIPSPGQNIFGVQSADFNGDGAPDLAVSYLVNTSPVFDELIYDGRVTSIGALPVSLSPGSHQITAAFSGDAPFASSSSSPVTIDSPTATPVFTPPAGTYSAAQTVTITDATPGTAIYYTLDGTTPTTSSPKYTTPISILTDTTINALAVSVGPIDKSASAAYRISRAVPVTTTNTVLTVSPSGTLAPGAVVTLKAAVTAEGNPVTRGIVDFCDTAQSHCVGAGLLGELQLTNSGFVTEKLRFGIGTHTVKAVFHALKTLKSSESSVANLTVSNPFRTLTTLGSNESGGSYTFTGTVASPGTSAPTGTVSFSDASHGGAPLGSALLSGPAGRIFSPSVVSNVPGPLIAYQAQDMNNDGIPDLVVTTSGVISVLLGKGDGTFTVKTTQSGLFGGSIAIADFNLDGIPDLAAVGNAAIGNSSTNTPKLTLFLGVGDGTFTALTPAALPGLGYNILAGDFNSDGIPDVATDSHFVDFFPQPGTFYDDRVVVYLGDGNGGFQPGFEWHTGWLGDASLATGDFDGDGNLDLAYVGVYQKQLVVLGGYGDGTFVSRSSPVGGDDEYEYIPIYVWDTNGDGILDASLTSPPPPFPLPTDLGSVQASADFDGDGLPDLVRTLGNFSVSTALTAYLTRTTASATVTTPLAPGSYVVSASYAGDSRHAASTSSTSHIYIPAQNTPTPAPVFSPPAGTYQWTQNIRIADTVPGMTIYYTSDGSTPTTSSTKYTGPIVVTWDANIKAIAAAPGAIPSQVVTAVYSIERPINPPYFTLPSGAYTSPQTLRITGGFYCQAPSICNIYYTTDGSTPTTSSRPYRDPIQLTFTAPVTVKAIMTSHHFAPSPVASVTLTPKP